MNTPMTAPGQNFPVREKRSDVTLVPQGFLPAILYAIIDLGTQESNYDGKVGEPSRKVKFMFEFPTHKQLFYVDDTEFKPSVLSQEFAFAMYVTKQQKKTKMLETVESMLGRVLDKQEWNSFDISQLLGKYYTVAVQHYVKKSGALGAKIQVVTPFNAQFFAQALNSGELNPTNPNVLYSLNFGFESTAFASVNYYDRKAIKQSKEAIAHVQRGGKFVKFDENNNLIYDDAPIEMPQQAQTMQQHYQQAVQQQPMQGQPMQQQQPVQYQQPVQQVSQPQPMQQAPAPQYYQQPAAVPQAHPVQQPYPSQAPIQPAGAAAPIAPQPVQPGQVVQQAPGYAAPQAPVQGMQQPQQQIPISPGSPADATPAQMFQNAPAVQPNAAAPMAGPSAVQPAQSYANQPVQHPGAVNPAQGNFNSPAVNNNPSVPQAQGTMGAPAQPSYGGQPAPMPAQPVQQVQPQAEQISVFDQQSINWNAQKEEEHDDLPF